MVLRWLVMTTQRPVHPFGPFDQATGTRRRPLNVTRGGTLFGADSGTVWPVSRSQIDEQSQRHASLEQPHREALPWRLFGHTWEVVRPTADRHRHPAQLVLRGVGPVTSSRG